MPDQPTNADILEAVTQLATDVQNAEQTVVDGLAAHVADPEAHGAAAAAITASEEAAGVSAQRAEDFAGNAESFASAAASNASGAASSAQQASESADAAAAAAAAAATDAVASVAARIDGISAAIRGNEFSFSSFNPEDMAAQQDELTQYALEQLVLEDAADIPNGITVRNMNGNKVLIFKAAVIGDGTSEVPEFPAHWEELATADAPDVPIATNTTLGLVKGSTDALKASVGEDGTLTVNNVTQAVYENSGHWLKNEIYNSIFDGTGMKAWHEGYDSGEAIARVFIHPGEAEPFVKLEATDFEGASTQIYLDGRGRITFEIQGGESLNLVGSNRDTGTIVCGAGEEDGHAVNLGQLMGILQSYIGGSGGGGGGGSGSGGGTVITGSRMLTCILYAGPTLPADAVRAKGGMYSALDYPEAAAALGSRYGGDGVTYFGIPTQPANGNGMEWIFYIGLPARGVPLHSGDGHYCGDADLYPGITSSAA
ncbi:MAG: tail fiber protein [Desulfovibrio sp.]|jgi:hypothetical protein|nr:tail fiber protein [Desulfovibrio sp.]